MSAEYSLSRLPGLVFGSICGFQWPLSDNKKTSLPYTTRTTQESSTQRC